MNLQQCLAIMHMVGKSRIQAVKSMDYELEVVLEYYLHYQLLKCG